MYNAVCIDISKEKSTVILLQPGGTAIRKPVDVSHTSQNLNEPAPNIICLLSNAICNFDNKQTSLDIVLQPISGILTF